LERLKGDERVREIITLAVSQCCQEANDLSRKPSDCRDGCLFLRRWSAQRNKASGI
jgi:hypothetical protein